MKLFVCGKVGSHAVVRINTERAHVRFACFRQLPAEPGRGPCCRGVRMARWQGIPLPSDGLARLSLTLTPGQRLPFAASIILLFQERYVDETRPCVLAIGYWLFSPQPNSLETHLDYCMSAVSSFFFLFFFLLSGPQAVSGLQCLILTC